MLVTKIRKNIMRTISFTAKFKGMRKEQEFIVHPNPDVAGILIQSDNRVGRIRNNEVTFSKGQMFLHMAFNQNTVDVIDNIDELRSAIRSTAGDCVGDSKIIYTNNSNAALV